MNNWKNICWKFRFHACWFCRFWPGLTLPSQTDGALRFMPVKQDMSTGAPVSTAIALADSLEVLVAVACGLHSGLSGKRWLTAERQFFPGETVRLLDFRRDKRTNSTHELRTLGSSQQKAIARRGWSRSGSETMSLRGWSSRYTPFSNEKRWFWGCVSSQVPCSCPKFETTELRCIRLQLASDQKFKRTKWIRVWYSRFCSSDFFRVIVN